MLRFKKEYAGQSIALPTGLLISAANIGSKEAQKALKALPALDYMLEEVAEPTASTATEPPVTGGGGAGDPRVKKARVRSKKS